MTDTYRIYHLRCGMTKNKAPKKEAGSTKKTYVVSGSVTDVEVRQAATKEGPKPYAVARITTAGKDGKNGRVIPVLTFYPTGVKALQGKKDGAKVKVFGQFETFTGKDGKKKQTFALIGNHTPNVNKEKPAEVNIS